MNAIVKARAWTSNVKGGGGDSSSLKMPGVFMPPYGGGGYYGQGYRLQQILHYKFWGFVAIKAWIREIAGGDGPLLGSIKPRDKTQGHKRKVIRKALGGPKAHQEFDPYDDDHPLIRLFSNPNGPDVAYDLWAYDTLFFLLCGSSHWWILKNKFGTPVEIWVIPTHWMRMVTDGGKPVGYAIQSPFGVTEFAKYEDVVSFYEHSPLNRWEGYAVSQAIDEWLDLYDSMTRTRLATMKNGAVPAFHVELGEAYADPDEQFLARYYSKWFSRFQGENRAGLPLITGADVKVTPIGVAPKDIGFEVGEDQIRNMVLAAYGVPKAIVGLTDSMTYGSVEASKDAFREFAVNSHLTYRGQVITEKIIKPCDESGICYWEDRMKGDPDYRLREQAQDLATGVRFVNEVRSLRGLETYEHGGDDPQINGAVVPWATGKRAPAEQLLDQALASAAASGKVTDDMLASAMQNSAKQDQEGQIDGQEHGDSQGQGIPSESGEDRGIPVSPAQSPAVAGDLKSTVGGSAQIMQMQAALAKGDITREMAIANAQIVFGFNQQDAERLFPEGSQAGAIKSRILASKGLDDKKKWRTPVGDLVLMTEAEWRSFKSAWDKKSRETKDRLDRMSKEEFSKFAASHGVTATDYYRQFRERFSEDSAEAMIKPEDFGASKSKGGLDTSEAIKRRILGDRYQPKDLGESTGSTGGYLVPPEYANGHKKSFGDKLQNF